MHSNSYVNYEWEKGCFLKHKKSYNCGLVLKKQETRYREKERKREGNREDLSAREGGRDPRTSPPIISVWIRE